MSSVGHKPEAEGSGDSDIAFTLAVAFIALLPRLFVAIAWAKEPVWDGYYYHFGAERIAQGLGYSEDVIVNGQSFWKPWSHYPVGFSAFLAGIYLIFGSSLLVAPVTGAISGTLIVVCVHRLARYYTTPTRARIAAGLAAVHPGLICYAALVMTEPLAALLLLLAPLAALRWAEQRRGVVLAGIFFGLATLVRPSSILAAPLLALTQPKPWSRALVRTSVAAAIAIVVVLPWTVRNCVRMDGCAFVSTNAGWNLAIGALSETGRFRTLRASDGCPVVKGQVQQDRCWLKVGREAIARDIGRWLSLIPKKLSHTYDHESFAIEYLHEADPDSWPSERRAAGRQLLSQFHRMLLILAVFAPIALVRRPVSRHDYWRADRGWVAQTASFLVAVAVTVFALWNKEHPFYLLALAAPLLGFLPIPGRPAQGPAGYYLFGLLAITTITHAVFFGDDRYHLVITPALCILAAAALGRSHPSKAREPASSAGS